MGNTSRSAAYLLAGIAAGITLGMLFAPRKGSENREKLGSSVQTISEKFLETATMQIDGLLNFATNIVSALKTNNDMYATQYDEIENAII